MRRLPIAVVTALSVVAAFGLACLLYPHAWRLPIVRDAKLFFALWLLALPVVILVTAGIRLSTWRAALRSASLCMMITAPLYFGVTNLGKVRASSIDKAVLCNARQLAAAADQYYLENATTTVARAALVGPTNYIKALNVVAGETYPATLIQGRTITVTGIANARTITYVP